MINLGTRTRIISLISAAKAGDWPAIFNGLRDCSEDVRQALVEMLLGDLPSDPVPLSKALQYLEQVSNPAVAVRAAVIIIALSSKGQCQPAT